MWIAISVIAVVFVISFILALLVVNSSEKNKKYKQHIEEFNKYEQERFGKAGEEYVASMLEAIQQKYKSYIFNDYTFKDDKGYSSNIDHIFICVGGIFIIETKSNKGIIHGSESDEYWYAEKEEWQDDKKFRNPVIQNQGHINHLRRMFKNNPPKMYSLVIFPAADSIDDVDSIKVYDVESAYNFILEKINEEKYSNQFVDRMYTELNDIINQYGITIEEHINITFSDKFQ